MIFFKKMTAREKANSERSVGVGFLVYLLVTGVNYFYYLLTDHTLLSPGIVFWAGLIALFGYDWFLNSRYRADGAARNTRE